jgi:hypothetical protein
MRKSAAPKPRSRVKRPSTPGKARRPVARKISITVDERVLRQVERDARQRGRSLSAHITDALARDLRRQRLREIVDEYETEHGAFSEQELAAVQAQWRD